MKVQNVSPSDRTLYEAVAINPSPPVLPAIIEQTAQRVFAKFSQRLKSSLNGRQERGLKLALNGHVTHLSGRVYAVRSEKGDHLYRVNLEKRSCTCPDSKRGHICKHRVAAYLIEQASFPTRGVADDTQSTAQHPPDPSNLKALSPEEEALQKARLVFQARSQHLSEAIVYAIVQVEGKPIQVELVSLEGDAALVRALPILKDGELVPQFPFPERKSSAQVLAGSLTDLRFYR
jgi:uncharacterized Zn finger protein